MTRPVSAGQFVRKYLEIILSCITKKKIRLAFTLMHALDHTVKHFSGNSLRQLGVLLPAENAFMAIFCFI